MESNIDEYICTDVRESLKSLSDKFDLLNNRHNRLINILYIIAGILFVVVSDGFGNHMHWGIYSVFLILMAFV
jgi:hypothetical protein